MEEFDLRNLYALIALTLLLGAACAASGHFKAPMDVDTFIDKNQSEESFSESSILWATSINDTPIQQAYLSFENNFATAAISSPNDIESATLKIYATKVNKSGKVTAYFMHGAILDTATWDDKATYDKDLYKDTKAEFDVTKTGVYTINAAPFIKKAIQVCNEGCPYSIVLVAQDNASIGFASMEGSSSNMADLEFNTTG